MAKDFERRKCRVCVSYLAIILMSVKMDNEKAAIETSRISTFFMSPKASVTTNISIEAISKHKYPTTKDYHRSYMGT